MADPRENQGMNIEQDFIARVSAGVRMAVSTVTGGSWFGPGQSMEPQAQEKANNRAFDFPNGVNTRTSVRSGEGVTFKDLRGLADGYDLLRLIIETRKDQIESYEWEVIAIDSKQTKARAQDIIDVTNFLQQPSLDYDWPTWIRALLDDLLVLDAVTIYPRYNRGGNLISLDLIDAATIKRVLDDTGRTPMAPDPAYQQILKGISAVNYSADELIYWMRNPRTYKIYGFSPVEQIIMTVNIALRRQLSQLQYYTEGNVPEAIASVPDGWTPDQIAQFQIWWDGLMEGNTASKRHMKFLPVDASKVQMIRQPELKDMYDEWLARIVCFAFSIPAHPFVKETNRSTAETAAAAAKEEGLVPTLIFLERRINHILRKFAGVEGLKFQWKMNNTIDPSTQADIHDKYLKNGSISVDEVREDLGKEKLNVGNMIYGTPATPIHLFSDQTELPKAIPPTVPGQEGAIEKPTGEETPKKAAVVSQEDAKAIKDDSAK